MDKLDNVLKKNKILNSFFFVKKQNKTKQSKKPAIIKVNIYEEYL